MEINVERLKGTMVKPKTNQAWSIRRRWMKNKLWAYTESAFT